MHALIVAAGFATRLGPLTANKPKALLPLVHKTVLDRQLDWLGEAGIIDTVTILSNERFAEQFHRHLLTRQPSVEVHVLSNGVKNLEEAKSLADDIYFGFSKVAKYGPTIVMGSDNLFTAPLEEFVNFHRTHDSPIQIAAFNRKHTPAHTHSKNELSRNPDGLVTRFIEKPRPTTQNLYAPLLYIFKPEAIKVLERFLSKPEAEIHMGSVISWAVANKVLVQAHLMSGQRLDTGEINSYNEAKRYFLKKS